MFTKFNLIQKPTSDIIPMKSVNTSDQRYDYSDSDSSLKMAKLIHGVIDFKQDGMNLGFSLLVEGKMLMTCSGVVIKLYCSTKIIL